MSAAPAPPVARPLLRTPLYEFHRAHGAHTVPFAGWEMPLYYDSILTEHEAVRSRAGLFDVSHMGILTVDGGHAADLLAHRTTANVLKLEPGQCRYTFLLEATGAIVDDLLITRLDDGTHPERSFLVVPNAASASLVFDILRAHRRPDTRVERHNSAVAILAVQGPEARAILERTFGWSLAGLKYYSARKFPAQPSPENAGSLGVGVPGDLESYHLVSRTGYTGEPGYEMFVRGSDAPAVADRLVDAGAKPCGLGARDTLRLEKGFLLSGQDFLRDRTPLEAGQERFVDFDHEFVGRVALEQQRQKGVPARLVGIRVDVSDAIPRHGTPVLYEGAPVAVATSGGQSPSLKAGIALAFLPPPLAVPGTAVTMEIRGRPVPAQVVPLPFYAGAPARR